MSLMPLVLQTLGMSCLLLGRLSIDFCIMGCHPWSPTFNSPMLSADATLLYRIITMNMGNVVCKNQFHIHYSSALNIYCCCPEQSAAKSLVAATHSIIQVVYIKMELYDCEPLRPFGNSFKLNSKLMVITYTPFQSCSCFTLFRYSSNPSKL